MDRLGDQFLACPGLPLDQDRGIALGQPLCIALQPVHLRAFRDEVGEGVARLVLGLPGSTPQLVLERLDGAGALENVDVTNEGALLGD